jgi:hypothetical protein
MGAEGSKDFTLIVQNMSGADGDFHSIKIKSDATFLDFRKLVEKESKIPIPN